jgi:hypothetical protein
MLDLLVSESFSEVIDRARWKFAVSQGFSPVFEVVISEPGIFGWLKLFFLNLNSFAL